jgi:glutamate synthase (NADPH/NADH) small chain
LKEYDRVILCCGAKNPRDINVPGRDAKGIHFAVDFLTSTTKSLLDNGLTKNDFISAKGKKVIIIGGGDTGNDCVGTSIRHGAASVMQIEMMPKAPDERAENNPWPEWPKVCKTDYGQEEAIAVFGHDPRVYETTVTEFLKDKKGNLRGVKTVRLAAKTGEDGRTVMEPVEGTEQTLEADLVLIAAGFLGAQDYVSKAFKVDVTPRTCIATQDGSYETSVKNVFAAGDVRRGQSLVVWAIREGREVARAVDLDLMGYTNLSIQ